MSRFLSATIFFAVLFAIMPECGSFQLQQPGQRRGDRQSQEQAKPPGQAAERAAKISSRIGLCTDFLRLKSSERQGLIGLMKPLGKRTVREPFNWNVVEPEKGKFRWDAVDSVVEDIRSSGLEILAVLSAAPEWAGGRNTKTGSFPPEDPEDYGRFVEAFVTRYKGKIKSYELWNEPNMPRFWGGRKSQPEEFVALLKAGYRAGKKADPEAVFVMGGVTRLLVDREYIREVFALGGLEACDAVGIHLYPDDFDTFRKQVKYFMSALDKMNADNPVWITEVGWASRDVDMEKFMAFLKEKGVTREDFSKSVALRRALGQVFEFTEDEMARSQDETARSAELAGLGLTESGVDTIIKKSALDRVQHQVETLIKLSAFIENNPRLEMVFWYRYDDKFDTPIKAGNFGILDVHGKPKPAFKLMAGEISSISDLEK